MRNLYLQGELRRTVSSSLDSNSSLVDICEVISESGEAHRALLTKDGSVINVADDGTPVWTCRLDRVCENKKEAGWFSLTHVDPYLVCLSHGGAIVTVSPETGQADLVGEFENGIDAGVWSPDRELLLLVTSGESDDDEPKRNSVLLCMNSHWEVLAEINIEKISEDIDKCTVSVCWRPDGALCAVSTVDEEDSMRKIRLYKRENLDFHAIGRTEDGSGKLVPNILASQIAWAGPACSQVLAGVIGKGKKIKQVGFFEPNGLRHREFTLREDARTSVLELAWNIESDILAVSLSEDSCDKVQLWHRSNYHWYLKKEFQYTSKGIARIKFHEEDAYTLYVIFESDFHWREYRLRWDPSTVGTLSKSCTAFTIDGCLLNMTPMDKALVPPPMSAASLTMPSPVSELALAPENPFSIVAAVILADGTVGVLKSGESNGKDSLIPGFVNPNLSLVSNSLVLSALEISSLRNLLVIGVESSGLSLVGVSCADDESCETLYEISLVLSRDQDCHLQIRNVLFLESPVLRMVNWSDHNSGALVELKDGQLLEYDFSEDCSGTLKPSIAEPFLEPCSWIAALKNVSELDDGRHQERKRLFFGLSSRSRLYCQDLLLADSVSSFFLSIAHQYLCYATAESRCHLRFLPLMELHNFDPLMGTEENYVLEGYEMRAVERGARLVAVLPGKPTAVLQMPRGNLEGIYPRALVLRCVMLKIVEGCYREAFEMMRCQKVDLNLIVDMNPRHFLEDGGLANFVEQVENIDHLNLFISCLQNWDVTKVRHPVPVWISKAHARREEVVGEFDFASKVNQVCRKMREMLLEAERVGKTVGGRQVSDGHYLLPILSTFAKEEPPKLEDALSLIKDIAVSRHPLPSNKPPLFSDNAQNAIQYLAFLAEYELLFDTALGMYDYDISRAVARNSNMDPKVYLPLLKRYRELPVCYGRYEVDLRLKRYESALNNLYESYTRQESFEEFDGILQGVNASTTMSGNCFEECMSLIEEHKLHRLGLKLFHGGDQERRIMLSLGDYLMDQRQAETALSVFLASDPLDIERAKNAARSCRDWRTFFNLVLQEGEEAGSDDSMHPSKRSLLSREVAEELALTAEGQFQKREILVDAARIRLDYANDFVGAVDMLIRAEMWTEGRRIAQLASRDDLVRKCIDEAVSYAYTAINDLEERKDTFQITSKRYSEVLRIRQEAHLAGEGDFPGSTENDDNGSLFSTASDASNLSMRSAASHASLGSAASVSSVISVKSTSSFSLSGADESFRHKSKYNKVGRNKKRNKKKGKGRSKVRPGSEQELKSLVETLKAACVDTQNRDVIAETITFLSRVNQTNTARALFDAFCETTDVIKKVQSDRIESARQERLNDEKKARREGTDCYGVIVHPVEKEVDALSCSLLPQTVYDFFSYIQD